MESTAGEEWRIGKLGSHRNSSILTRSRSGGEKTDKQLTGRKNRRWDGMGYTIGYDGVQVINQVGSELERQSVGS